MSRYWDCPTCRRSFSEHYNFCPFCCEQVSLVIEGLKAKVAALTHQRNEWKGSYDGMDALCKQQQERAEAAELESANLRHDIERQVQIAAELATECEKLRKDAERYRWLRTVDPDAELPAVMIHKQNDWGNWKYLFLDGKQLDAAIDKARMKE